MARNIVLNGASYHFLDSIDHSPEQADGDLYFNIERGNNKSASGNGDFITKSLEKEVSRGWMFPIPVSCLPNIPGIAVTPIGVAHQNTLSEEGQVIPKDRMTHDCSHPSKSGHSLNSRINKEMMEIVFGVFFIKFTNYALKIQGYQFYSQNWTSTQHIEE